MKLLFLLIALVPSIDQINGEENSDGPIQFSIPILSAESNDNPIYRKARHFFRARLPLDRGIHYAWQNPVRTAPTLPSPEENTPRNRETTASATVRSPWWQDRDRDIGRNPAQPPPPEYPTYYPTTTEATTEYYDRDNDNDWYGNRPATRRPEIETTSRVPFWWQDRDRYPAESIPGDRKIPNPTSPQYPTTTSRYYEPDNDKRSGNRPGIRNPPRPGPTSRTPYYPSQTTPDYDSESEFSPSHPSMSKPNRKDQNGRENSGERGRRPQPRPTCPPGSRLSRESGRCYELGSKGPCNENMAFYSDPEDQGGEYGVCDCFQNFNRPLVYHRETEKCYFIFQQAFCRPGQWLILDPDLNYEPVCSPNHCLRWNGDDSSWDWTNNGPELDMKGVVAIIKERVCAVLQWQCTRESRDVNEKLLDILRERKVEGVSQEIVLKFNGPYLACRKESSVEFPVFGSDSRNRIDRERNVICKPGLDNKRKIDGGCERIDINPRRERFD